MKWGRYWIFVSLRSVMLTRPFRSSGEVGHGPLEQHPIPSVGLSSECIEGWHPGVSAPATGSEGRLAGVLDDGDR